MNDLKFAVRQLLKNPGFTAVVVLTLALGIGASCSVFSVVNAVLLRPLPFRGSDRFVELSGTQQLWGSGMAVSYPDFADWREQSRSFASLAAYAHRQDDLAGSGEAERISGAQVSPSFFPLLGAKPARGRAFLEAEDRAGAARVVVLSHGMWQRRFGGTTDVLGQTLRLSDKVFTVVGVLPPDFEYPPLKEAEFWIPLVPNLRPEALSRGYRSLHVIGGLKPDATLVQAQEEMSGVAQRLAQAYPQSNAGSGVKLAWLSEQIVGDARLYLWVLMGIIGFVWLIACANVVNLVLARASSREKEMAVRAALGASAARLVRQILTESFLMSLLGGVAGLLVASWSAAVLRVHLAGIVPRATEIDAGLRVWVFGLSTSLFTGLLLGLVPALRLRRAMPGAPLMERGTMTLAKSQLSHAVVVVEVAAACVVLIGAGLMIRTCHQLVTLDPGFQARQLLTFEIALPRSRYPEVPQRLVFCQQALERLAAVPGVKGAALDLAMPFSGQNLASVIGVFGRPESEQPYPIAICHPVTPEYFDTLKIPLRMALGAPQLNILAMILKRGLALSLLGSGLGLAGALALTRFLQSYLYQVSPTDPWVFAGVTLFLVAVALGACWLPARRAAKVDPTEALRTE